MSSTASSKRQVTPNTLPSRQGVIDWLKPFLCSSVGMKATTAITGFLLTGFVIVHLLGNLKLFGGRDAINAYAAFLKDLGPWLWVARGGLLAVFCLHVYLALTLARRAKAARPIGYQYESTIQASAASRTMPWTGIAILAFVVFHLAHLTFGWVGTTRALDPSTGGMVATNYLNLVDPAGRHDVYSMMVAGFKQPLLAGLYVLAQLALFAHLSHGIGSVLQTLGLNSPRLQPFVTRCSRGLALLIAAGNIAIVVAVLTGYIPEVEKLARH